MYERLKMAIMQLSISIMSYAGCKFFIPWLWTIGNGEYSNPMSETWLSMANSLANLSLFCCVFFAGKVVREFLRVVIYDDYNLFCEDNSFDSSEDFSLVIPNKRGEGFKHVDIDISNLSENTKDEVFKIKDKLRELYDTAKSSRKAFRTFMTYDVYLQSLADDVKKAIDECQGSEAEKILVSRIPIVIKNIDIIQQAINDDIKHDNLRIMLIILCLALCALFTFFFPWLRNNCKIPITDGMSKAFKMMDAIGSFLCAIFAIVETTNIIIGVSEHKPVNKIRFIIPNNQCWRKTKYVGIDISGLSVDAIKEVIEIKNKLWDLYCIASCSKQAFKKYLTYDEHLQSIADDVINAINECREPDCENILVSKLSAITKDIDTIRRSMWLEI